MALFSFGRTMPVDAHGKATTIQLFNLRSRHMRMFHLSWLAFFAAFTSWFALNPLLKATIGPDLKIVEHDLASSDMANVGSTIAFRIVIGFVVDKIGPAKSMGAILLAGAIPVALVGTVKNASGLITIRSFIGLLGASFVPCQAWTTAFFAKKVVGTANAVVGGWGNMGGGATFLIMPHVFNGIVKGGLTRSQAWKVACVLPACICIIIGLVCLIFGKDKPEPAFPVAQEMPGSTEITIDDAINKEHHVTHDVSTRPTTPTKKVTSSEKAKSIFKSLATPTILILMLQYACSFGVELAVDSQIGTYLQNRFGLTQTLAGNLGSIFGMMNLFSRATGGIVSDILMRKYGIKGRVMLQVVMLAFNGAFLLAFAFSTNLTSAIVLMIFFSFFTEATCGSTFGVVPYIAEGGMGAASGLVGAGGTLGGFVFNTIFKKFVGQSWNGFKVMAGIVLFSSFAGLFVSVRSVYVWSKHNLRDTDLPVVEEQVVDAPFSEKDEKKGEL